MKKNVLFILILLLISFKLLSQKYTIQNYTVTSAKKEIGSNGWEDISDEWKGKLVTYDPNNNKFWLHLSSTEASIFTIISIPEKYSFYDNERKVFVYNCIDERAKTCKIYISYPPKSSNSIDVTLFIQYEDEDYML